MLSNTAELKKIVLHEIQVNKKIKSIIVSVNNEPRKDSIDGSEILISFDEIKSFWDDVDIVKLVEIGISIIAVIMGILL